MDTSKFAELSDDAQKMYAEIVRVNLNAMSSFLVLMMNQSNAMAKGDMNLASSSVVQSMLIAIEKLIASLLKDNDYVTAIKQCEEFFQKVAIDVSVKVNGGTEDDNNS